MTRPRKGETRIAIGGRYLDRGPDPAGRAARGECRRVSFVSGPAPRAHVDGDHVTVSVPAQTVVKLFADGVPPSLGGRAVVVEVGDQQLGPCILESVESGATNAVDDMIVLRFRSVEAKS